MFGNDRAEFIRVVQEAQDSQQTAEVRKKKTRLATAKNRLKELEVLLCKIYEDNILGKLPDNRYATLDAQYGKEQAELTKEISSLEASLTAYEKNKKSAENFISLIDKYQSFDMNWCRNFKHRQQSPNVRKTKATSSMVFRLG